MAELQQLITLRVSQTLDGLSRQLQWYAVRLTAVMADSLFVLTQDDVDSLISAIYKLTAMLNIIRFKIWRKLKTVFPQNNIQQAEVFYDPGPDLRFTPI